MLIHRLWEWSKPKLRENYLQSLRNWQIPWSTLGKVRATKRRQTQQNQPTRSLLDDNSRWFWTLYSPSNTSIYRKRRNLNAKKWDWNAKRRKQQTKTPYEWERNVNKTSQGNIKRRNGQTNVANRNPTNAKASILKKYNIRKEKQISSNSKHSRWSVFWGNIKTSEALYCPFNNWRNPR